MPERLPPSPFDALLETEWISVDPTDARARITMRDALRQPMGIMHGGVMASLVESVCSMATGVAIFPENRIAMGQGITMNLLRPVSSGAIEVRAEAVHMGRMTWVWRALVYDSEGKICATGQMTMAVREAPEGVDLTSFAAGSPPQPG